MRAPGRDAGQVPFVDIARPPRDGRRPARILRNVLACAATGLEDMAMASCQERPEHRPDRLVIARKRRPAQPAVRWRLLARAEFDDEIRHHCSRLNAET